MLHRLRHRPPLPQHQQVREANFLQVLEDVGREDQGDFRVVVQLRLHLPQQLDAGDGIESGGRLVQEQQFRALTPGRTQRDL